VRLRRGAQMLAPAATRTSPPARGPRQQHRSAADRAASLLSRIEILRAAVALCWNCDNQWLHAQRVSANATNCGDDVTRLLAVHGACCAPGPCAAAGTSTRYGKGLLTDPDDRLGDPLCGEPRRTSARSSATGPGVGGRLNSRYQLSSLCWPMRQRSRPNRSASRTALSSSGAPTRTRHQFDASHPSAASLSRFRQRATPVRSSASTPGTTLYLRVVG
jgi:hypothetical protein